MNTNKALLAYAMGLALAACAKRDAERATTDADDKPADPEPDAAKEPKP